MHANQLARIRQTAEIAIQNGMAHGVSVDELTDHMVRIEEFAISAGVRLEWTKFPLTVSDAELQAAAESKIKAAKRSAGARALSNKYGKEAAERIIEKHTGKHITLQR